MDLAERLAALEAVIYAGIPAWSFVQTVSVPGPIAIVPANGLLAVLAAPGPIQISLPLPTALQNGFTITFLNANGQQNTVTTAGGGIFTGTDYESTLLDGGEVGNFATLNAQNGLWTFGGGRSGCNPPWLVPWVAGSP